MRRSIHGSETSQSSASTTIAVAHSATVTDGSPTCSARAARGAREEDHAVGRARDVLERADHLGLAAPGPVRDRYGRPHALLELAAELVDEALLVLGHLDVALGDQ